MNATTPRYLFFFLLSGLLWLIHVPTVAALTQTEIQKLLASDGADFDAFGVSVSVSGDTAVIAAGSESAYVFVRSDNTWSEQAKLTASDAALNGFGRSVSVSGDTALIGAIFDDNAGSNTGSAYVFVRTGSTWSEQAKLIASDATATNVFGSSVSINGDTAVIGAPFAGSFAGAAYIFVRNGTTWNEQIKLTPSDAAADSQFGRAVSIDGDTVVIGSDHNPEAGSDSGSAYVFIRSDNSWSEQAKLTPSDAAEDDRFGSSVSINGDTALIGSYRDDDAGTESGSAYVFVRNGNTWNEQAKLVASDGTEGDWFGFSVSTSGDTAVVGAWAHDYAGNNSGSAYVFVRSGTTWSEQSKLIASDAAEDDLFGRSVSVSGDTAMIGSSGADASGTNIGSTYVFDLRYRQPNLQNVSGYFPALGPDDVEEASLDTDEVCKPGFNAGTFTIRSRFENISTDTTLSNLVFKVSEISDTAALCNTDSPAGSEGGLLTVALKDDYRDGSLEPGEYFVQTFKIGLTRLAPFRLVVDLLGVVEFGNTPTLLQNAGEILNSMSGQDLIAHASRVSERLDQAMGVATLVEVIGPTETVGDPSGEFPTVPTVITNTRSIFQCNSGGTLESLETLSSNLFESSFTLGETIDTNRFSAKNCKSQISDSQSTNFSLDGSFETIRGNLFLGREGESTSTHTWRSLRLIEESQGVQKSFFTDAQIRDERYRRDVFSGEGRSVTIAEFEHSTDNGSSMRLESVDYSQNKREHNAGVITESFRVSGMYTGRLSDDYQVTVSSDPGFHVISGDHPDFEDQYTPPSGSFSMYSGNGDHLLITVSPVSPVGDFYLADFTSTRADGSSQILSSVPFFRFTMKDKPFAVTQP